MFCYIIVQYTSTQFILFLWEPWLITMSKANRNTQMVAVYRHGNMATTGFFWCQVWLVCLMLYAGEKGKAKKEGTWEQFCLISTQWKSYWDYVATNSTFCLQNQWCPVNIIKLSWLSCMSFTAYGVNGCQRLINAFVQYKGMGKT